MSIDQFTKLIKEKHILFSRFEKVTEEMLFCNANELERLLTDREWLIDQINRIDEKMICCYESAETGQKLKETVFNEGNPDDLDEDFFEIHNLASQTRSIVTRLTETETQVGIRLRLELEQILTQIKSTNRGTEAQASRFLSAKETAALGPFHVSNA